MKSIFYLQKSMMVHLPASYISNSYLGDYSYSCKRWYTYYVHFEGGGVLGQGRNEMLSNVEGWGVASLLDFQSLFFLLQKIGFAPSPDIMLSQTLIYYWQEIFLLTVRQWRHPFMIPFALFVG